MSSNEYIVDRLSAHQLYIQRFAGKNVNELLSYIDVLEREVSLIIKDAKPSNKAKIIKQVNAAISNAVDSISEQLTLSLQDLAVYEYQFASGVIAVAVAPLVSEAITGKITKEQVLALTEKSLMNVQPNGKGITLGNAFKQFKSERNKAFAKIVRDTVKRGRSSRTVAREMVKEELKVSNLNTKKAIRKKSLDMRHKAETIIRTSVNHVASQAREQVFSDNQDIIEGYVYTATLDSRTTPICSSRSGNLYKGNEPRPPLPAHWNCRSLYVARLKKEYNLYNDEMKSDVNLNQTYQSFLKKQSKQFQEEVLGKKKAELFMSGKLTLDKFVDDTGKTYSIKTLAQLDKEYGLGLSPKNNS